MLDRLFHPSDDERRTRGNNERSDLPMDYVESGPKLWYSRFINRYISFTAVSLFLHMHRIEKKTNSNLGNRRYCCHSFHRPMVRLTPSTGLHSPVFIFGKNLPVHRSGFITKSLYPKITIFSGVSHFSVAHMIRVAWNNNFTTFFASSPSVPVVSNNPLNVGGIQISQLNDVNQDFAERKKYHRTEELGGTNNFRWPKYDVQ